MRLCYNSKEAAVILGISERHFRDLKKEHCLYEPSNKKTKLYHREHVELIARVIASEALTADNAYEQWLAIQQQWQNWGKQSIATLSVERRNKSRET